MKKLLTLLTIALLGGCADEQQSVADLQALRDAGDHLKVQINIRDAAAIAAVYAPNGAIMPPNAETITGREAIEAYWAEALGTGNIVGIKDAQVRVGGNIGYKVGAYTIASPLNQLIDKGKYVEVWHHSQTGWQLMYDIFNSDRAGE